MECASQLRGARGPRPGPGRLSSSQNCRLRSETAAHLRIALSQALMLSPDGEKPPTRPRTPTPPRRPRGEAGVECDLGFSSLLSNSVLCKLTGKHTWREKKSSHRPPGLSPSSPLRDSLYRTVLPHPSSFSYRLGSRGHCMFSEKCLKLSDLRSTPRVTVFKSVTLGRFLPLSGLV